MEPEPFASLVFDQTGNLYGTTAFGGKGSSNCRFMEGGGIVFKLTPNADGSWKESILHQFSGGRDGSIRVASLIVDAAGNLYGTTEFGGEFLQACKTTDGPGCDVVFKLAPNSKGGWTETVLNRFSDHPGAIPEAGVISDTAGNLYGTTAGDGFTTFGSVYELAP